MSASLPTRAEWPKGPWDDEPDFEAWTTKVGARAFLRRVRRLGHLCGYVAVGPAHPWHRRPWPGTGSAPWAFRGPVSFSGPVEDALKFDVARIPEVGPGLWCFGFDCMGFGDIVPVFEAACRELDPRFTYKTLAWVKARCEAMAHTIHQYRGGADAVHR